MTSLKHKKNEGVSWIYDTSSSFANYLFPLETNIESGAKSREISIVVFDVLERWLKGNGFRQLSFPRYFQRIF